MYDFLKNVFSREKYLSEVIESKQKELKKSPKAGCGSASVERLHSSIRLLKTQAGMESI